MFFLATASLTLDLSPLPGRSLPDDAIRGQVHIIQVYLKTAKTAEA